MTGLAFHPLADLFPLIEGAEFDALVEDIRVHGVREPIVLLDGKILDGRNRYRALAALRDAGELRGPGWGIYAGEAVTDETIDPEEGSHWPFRKYSSLESGDPLAFVLSRNLHRRHLSDRQRASIAGKLAALREGRPPARSESDAAEETPPIGGVSAERAGEMLNVSPRQVERSRVVHEQGVPELRDAFDRGTVAVSLAETIARLPEEEQRREVADRGLLPNGARAIMASRREPDDSLDYAPTPPWAVRALVRHVLAPLGVAEIGSAWDPACGEGHMTAVLEEFTGPVIGTDIFDYSRDGRMPPAWFRQQDFLDDAADAPVVDWIITNPPFGGGRAEAFTLRALSLARVGVAMFMRAQWTEGVDRYLRIFAPYRPVAIGQFAERVPLHMGRWEPDGSTATAYCWIVWFPRRLVRGPTQYIWIPPDRRKVLARPDDAERFTAHPVIGRGRCPEVTDARPSPPTGFAGPPSPDGEGYGASSEDEAGKQGTAALPLAKGEMEGDRSSSVREIDPLPTSPFQGEGSGEGDDGLDIPAFLRRDLPPARAGDNPADCAA